MSNAMSTLAFIKSMSAGGGGGEAESHMFLATYGTTTAAEVGAAYHANKVCYVLNSNEENLGVIVEENDTHYTFGCPKAKGTLLMSVNKTTNAWSTNFYSHYAVGGNGISVVHGEGTGATGNEETISAKVDGTTIGFDADGKLKTIGSSSDDTFIAEYNVTTLEQLNTAYAAGKNIICKLNGDFSTSNKKNNDVTWAVIMNLVYADTDPDNNFYVFACIKYGTMYTAYRGSEQWGGYEEKCTNVLVVNPTEEPIKENAEDIVDAIEDGKTIMVLDDGGGEGDAGVMTCYEYDDELETWNFEFLCGYNAGNAYHIIIKTYYRNSAEQPEGGVWTSVQHTINYDNSKRIENLETEVAELKAMIAELKEAK